jgi:hypothetical protein
MVSVLVSSSLKQIQICMPPFVQLGTSSVSVFNPEFLRTTFVSGPSSSHNNLEPPNILAPVPEIKPDPANSKLRTMHTLPFCTFDPLHTFKCRILPLGGFDGVHA